MSPTFGRSHQQIKSGRKCYVIQEFKHLCRELPCLFCFVALCPKSTAMVIAGRSVHLTTPFPGQA